MADDCVECSELAGKTIKSLRIYKNNDQGNEVIIDLTDGISFSCCLETKSTLSATLFRSGIGTPEVLRSYEP
jgi:hypothetical protein